jgi:uroporphyrinogen-III synthase
MTPSFQGLHVVALESRRATELAALISAYNGRPIMAPALREVPLESNAEALDFAAALMRDEFDVVVFLTGVGTRALANAIERAYSRDAFTTALARTKVVARGPKPLAVLRQLQVPIWVAAPEPNTWRELLAAIDAKVDAEGLGHASPATEPGAPARDAPLHDARIAVQEYGESNPELLEALRSRGARVTAVPVYRWALPENTAPLRDAVSTMSRSEVDVILFTTSVQVVHLWQIVQEMRLEAEVRRGLARSVIASIGPTTSEELRRYGLEADLEASHPKIGFLVREAAERCGELLPAKRSSGV